MDLVRDGNVTQNRTNWNAAMAGLRKSIALFHHIIVKWGTHFSCVVVNRYRIVLFQIASREGLFGRLASGCGPVYDRDMAKNFLPGRFRPSL